MFDGLVRFFNVLSRDKIGRILRALRLEVRLRRDEFEDLSPEQVRCIEEGRLVDEELALFFTEIIKNIPDHHET